MPYKSEQPSFAERTALLSDAANQLKVLADVVMLEALHMKAAEKRFSERRRQTKQKASR